MINLLIKKDLLQQGAVLIPDVLSDRDLSEVDQVSQELVTNWVDYRDKDKDFWWYTDSNKREILYRIHNLQKKHNAFLRMIHNKTLSLIRAFIYGEDSCYTECALAYKAPNVAAAVPWHVDPVCTPPSTIFNFSIYLDDSDQSNGAFEFLPFSHLQNINYATRPKGAMLVKAKKGDIMVHDVRVYHGSSSAIDNKQRRSIVIEYRKWT